MIAEDSARPGTPRSGLVKPSDVTFLCHVGGRREVVRLLEDGGDAGFSTGLAEKQSRRQDTAASGPPAGSTAKWACP